MNQWNLAMIAFLLWDRTEGHSNTDRKTNIQTMIDESMESGIAGCSSMKRFLGECFFESQRTSLISHVSFTLSHFTSEFHSPILLFWCHMLITHLGFTRPFYFLVSIPDYTCWHLGVTCPFMVSFADNTAVFHSPISLSGVICWLHIWVSLAHFPTCYHSLITHLGITRPLSRD